MSYFHLRRTEESGWALAVREKKKGNGGPVSGTLPARDIYLLTREQLLRNLAGAFLVAGEGAGLLRSSVMVSARSINKFGT